MVPVSRAPTFVLAMLAGCFAEPSGVAGDSDSGSGTGDPADGSSSQSQTQSTGSTDATTTTTTGATEATSEADTSTSVDASSSDGGEPDPFCDALPSSTRLCAHYDGETPYAGANVGQRNGTVDVTSDQSVTPSSSLVTTTNAGGDSTAELTYSMAEVPGPFEGSLHTSVWVEPECLGGGQNARRALSIVFTEPAGAIVFALNLRIGELETILYECSVPACDMSTAHPVAALVSAGEWLDFEIEFSASTGVATVSINGATTPIDLFGVDEAALANEDIVTHVIVGQSSPDAPACTMRFDDVVLDAS